MLLFLYIFLGLNQFNSVKSLNILGIFPYEGRSHFFVFEKYLEKLVEKGHNLTVISHFPREKNIPNYHDISLAGTIKIGEGGIKFKRSYSSLLQGMDYIISAGNVDCRVLLDTAAVQDLWKTKRTFDLVVIQHFTSDCALGLAYKIGAPVVALSSNTLMPWHYRIFGIPFNPACDQFLMTGGFKPNLYKRVETAILDFIINYKYERGRRLDQKTLSKYFDDIPPLEQLCQEIRFLLVYQDFVLTGSKLLPSNVVEVAGYHVMPPRPLPEDLLKFIEDSVHGVIYISFGSMLDESSFPADKLDAILNVLPELPQRVIWKWKGDMLPVNANHVYVSKWLPQNDILAHPKVLAFFTHGGFLGFTEAVHHGVPMVVMPVIGDQPLNAAAVEEFGFGVQIPFRDIKKGKLLKKLQTVLDPEFRNRVKNLSQAFRDRPVTPMETAIFWTEFAARYNLTLPNRGVGIPFYQYWCLDIIVVLVIFGIACLLVVAKVVSKFVALVKFLWNLKFRRVKRD